MIVLPLAIWVPFCLCLGDQVKLYSFSLHTKMWNFKAQTPLLGKGSRGFRLVMTPEDKTRKKELSYGGSSLDVPSDE